MKKMKTPCLVVLLGIALGNGLFSQELEFSGFLDSSVSMRAGAGEAPDFSWGLEEYANLRMQAKVKDRAVFYGAFNFIAASGLYAQNASALGLYQGSSQPGFAPSVFSPGENFIAGIELERLYFRLNGEYLDLDGGLMRLAFGYDPVFGPSDFLNPKNPLQPDARPRAVLGASLSWYPLDEMKLLAFAAAPKNPFPVDGGGVFAGFSVDRHWEKMSLQLLYAYETRKEGAKKGIHRPGLSVKADLVLGWVMDLLYTANPEAGASKDGLAASAGFDYSFWDGKIYILAEYLYNGKASASSRENGNLTGFSNENCLYTSALYRINDYTSVTLGCAAGLNDISFTPVLSAEYELFQGFTISFSGQVPLDRALFNGNTALDSGLRGELGPLPPGADSGSYFIFNAKARLRF
jgi:hypothetical protein